MLAVSVCTWVCYQGPHTAGMACTPPPNLSAPRNQRLAAHGRLEGYWIGALEVLAQFTPMLNFIYFEIVHVLLNVLDEH